MSGGLRTLVRWLQSIVDLKRLRGIIYLPRFVSHWHRYQSLSGGELTLKYSYPCLTDWVDTTPFDPHYFFQSAWLCRELQVQPPATRHVDVGSDVRMIASLSAFVPVEFVDYRPLLVTLPNLRCLSGDITSLFYATGSLDSVSSLHVVEHIGLGRYGDSIEVNGSIRALKELARVVALGGRLYVSVPVGHAHVSFNAHRVFDPDTIINAVTPLELVSFALVTDAGEFVSPAPLQLAREQSYACGMFVFRRS